MDFAALEAKYGSLMPQQQSKTTGKPRGRGGMLSSLISEAGGTGGAFGGAALGASIGSIVPGLGTAIGGLIGAGIGGFAGGTGGRVLENKIRDDRLGIGDALKEGAISGVMGAGPLRLLKTGGLAAKGVAKGATLADALVEAGTKATSKSLLSKAGGKVAEEGDALLTKSFRFTPSQLTNFKKKFGEDASQVIKKYGFTNADDITAKGIQPLQQQFDEIVESLPGVSRSSVQNALKTKYEPLIKSAVEDNVKIGNQLKSQAASITKKYGDVIDAKELNALRKEFDSLVNYTEKAANPSRYGVNKRAADALRTALQDAAESHGQPLKDVGKELNKLIQLSENASKQANLGRGSLPLNLSNLLGGAVGGSAAGLPGAAAMAATTAAANSNIGRRAIARGAEGIGNKLTGAGARIAGDGLGMAATRQLAGAGLRNARESLQPQSLEDALMQSQGGDYLSSNIMPTTAMNSPSAMTPSSANMGEQYQSEGDMSSDAGSPYTRENLIADIQRDPVNAEHYLDYYKQLDEIFAQPEDDQLQLSDGAIKNVTDLQSALYDIDSLGEKIQSSGVSGPITGRVRTANPFDTEAQSLQAEVNRVRQVVGKALEGGVLRKEDEIKYAKILPTVRDTKEVAANKLRELKIKLSQDLESYVALQQTSGKGRGQYPATLEQAVLQYQ